MNDNRIIELFFKRNENAIIELEKKYGSDMRFHSKRYLHDTRDAEEVYNDTLCEVWNSIPPDRPQKLRAYVLRVLDCNAISKLRYIGRHKRAIRNETLFSEFDDAVSFLDEKSNERSTEDVVINSNGGFINEFLSEETSENRRIFLKRYYFGKSMTEIAREQQTTEGAVYTRLSRIRTRLYKYLSEKGVII